jgi:hypothetical protein
VIGKGTGRKKQNGGTIYYLEGYKGKSQNGGTIHYLEGCQGPNRRLHGYKAGGEGGIGRKPLSTIKPP